MDELIQIVPFVAAMSLLIVGVVKRRIIFFVASFPMLLAASAFALAADGSSGAFALIGCGVWTFGLTCIVLSRRLQPGAIVSRDGLGAIGALLFFLGLAAMMIV